MAQLKTAARGHYNNASASSFSTASCSGLTFYPHYDFDVFINHRGPDVKNTFASDLYCRLRSHGMRVFLDKPEMKVGHKITPQILHAIETAPIHIAIFSSTYAQSKWCLDELLHMLKSLNSNQGTIIPVFYGVKPSDLRCTAKGAYAEAFHKHEMKRPSDTQIIRSWKEALSEVAEISGLELEAFNGDEGQLLEGVVQTVLKMVDETPLKYVAELPTGLKEKLEEIENTGLFQQDSVMAKVVGIVGLGGVGTTTLAKKFLNAERSDYSRASFLFDIRNNASKVSVNCLQQHLLKFLTQTDVQIKSISEGHYMGDDSQIREGEQPASQKQVLTRIRSLSRGFTVFEMETLVAATENFHDNNKIGQGGFGTVYKGITPESNEIAVKRLSSYSRQGTEEYLNEVNLVTQFQHRNVVKLLGCCEEEPERLLVYEYLPNTSLDKILFDSNKRRQLDWQKRYSIILGITRGLLYLHEDSHLRIIHRDIKPSNILLDKNLNPKIADFGLSRLLEEAETEDTVVGTLGYIPPEYLVGGKLSVKADVYSFGILLLELIGGRKNLDPSLGTQTQTLLEWAWKLYTRGLIWAMVDPVINETYSDQVGDQVGALRCVHVALLCTQDNPSDRPSMSTVNLMLSTGATMLPDVTKPFYIGSARTSEDTILMLSTGATMLPDVTKPFYIGSARTSEDTIFSHHGSSHTYASSVSSASHSSGSSIIPDPYNREL